MTAAQNWRTTLRDALLAARKDRDAVRVAALRSALSAIDNAETPDGARVAAPSSATIAGGVVGVGAPRSRAANSATPRSATCCTPR